MLVVVIYAVKTTYKRGLPVCEPDFRTGPLWAATEADVDAQATAWVKRTSPANRDWSQHHHVICQVPDSLVRQAALELEQAEGPKLSRKLRRRERESGNPPVSLVSNEVGTKIAGVTACDSHPGVTHEAERSLV